MSGFRSQFKIKPKYASRDADRGPWSSCDSCGFVVNQTTLQFQYAYVGSTTPQRTSLLVCPRCLDAPNPQNQPLFIPPDPAPRGNLRPEPLMVDEAGPTQELVASLSGSVGVSFYLDLYDAAPTQGGTSMLATLTGSATRTNYAASMATVGSVTTNTIAITITESADAGAFVWYVVIFDAATAGNILLSGSLLPPQTVSYLNGAQFAAGALTVTST